LIAQTRHVLPILCVVLACQREASPPDVAVEVRPDASHRHALFISEVMASSHEPIPGQRSGDWIEVVNRGLQREDLTGYVLKNEREGAESLGSRLFTSSRVAAW
jgi:hypothetical protein